MFWRPLEQTLAGRIHTEVGLKSLVSPRGCVTKAEELKSLLKTVQTTDLHLCQWLPKSSSCKISERIRSASALGKDLALAAVGFVDIYTLGLGQAELPP